jgi:hypothetical protein
LHPALIATVALSFERLRTPNSIGATSAMCIPTRIEKKRGDNGK